MVLFRMVDDHIIDPLHAKFYEVQDQVFFLGGINRIDQRSLLASPDEV